MAASKCYFVGFNGFGQFKHLPKIVTSFEEVNSKHHLTSQTDKIIVKSLWNYCAYAVNCVVYISGYMNRESNQEHCFPFEYPIQDIACTEHFCLVLLNIGIAYKINYHTFDINEINSTIIKRSMVDATTTTRMGKMFSNFNANHDNELNKNRDEFITHIAAGRSLTIIGTNKNSIYNMPLKIYTFPMHVKIKKISCGNEHCLILTGNGDLYAFGSSTRGQLGLGGLGSEEVPVLIEALAGIKIIDVAAGGWHSVAVSAFNDLYAWGWNVNGQIGQPLYKKYETKLKNGRTQIERQKCSTVFASPVIIDLMKDDGTASNNDEDEDDDNNFTEHQYHAMAVSAGARHTIVKVQEGPLMGTGWNKYGQLASNTFDKDVDQFHVINTNLSSDVNCICGEWSTFVVS